MRRTVGAVALLGVLAAAACTPDPVTPTPPPSPPVSQSPTGTAQERQERLDYAAAEKSYRTFRAEYNRVLRAGGAKEPTRVMKATAGGDYLAEFMKVAEAYKGLGSYRTGEERVVYVRPTGHQPSSVALTVCEDGTALRIYDQASKLVGRGEIRTAVISVRRTKGAWKVWSGQGKKATSCD